MPVHNNHATSTSNTVSTMSRKHETPELPLLEGAAHELAALREFDLLPTAVVDLQDKLEADTPATGAPTSPDDLEKDSDTEEENAFGMSPQEEKFCSQTEVLPNVMSPDRIIFVRNSFVDEEKDVAARPRSGSDWTGLRDMEARGLTEVDEVGLKSPLPSATAEEEGAEPLPGRYAPWWCLFAQDHSGGQRVEPLVDGQVDEAAPLDLANAMRPDLAVLWCWLQPDRQGQVSVTPCTMPAEPREKPVEPKYKAKPEKPLSEIEEECAPELPPAGSYALPDIQLGAEYSSDFVLTTLLLSNLPAELERDDLLEVLDKEDFCGFYDFVFLFPVAGKDRRAAVVNMTRKRYARTLADRLQGKAKWGEGICDGTLKCQVTWSSSQGLDALIELCGDQASDEIPAEQQPILMSQGWEVPLNA